MIPPALATLTCELVQIVQLMGTYDSKTDQTAQTDQRFETAKKFGALFSPELTSWRPELTSGGAQRSDPRAACAKNPISRNLLVADERLPQ
jgi:hypothetical protein